MIFAKVSYININKKIESKTVICCFKSNPTKSFVCKILCLPIITNAIV